MTDPISSRYRHYVDLPQELAQRVDEWCDEFESACQGRSQPNIESFVERVPAALRDVVIGELILVDMGYRHADGDAARWEDYLRRFPQIDRAWLVEHLPKVRAADVRPNDDEVHLPELPDYQIVGEVGRGGMGIVYQAIDRRLGRQVAIKVLLPQAASNPERVHRFLLEAKTASSLNHPSICTVHALGEERGCPYLVLEWIEGRTLRAIAAERLSPDRLWPVLWQIAEALAAAHDAGIVHRDMKPENVMVRPDGLAKLLDFGLARLTSSHRMIDEVGQGTIAGTLLGTIRYMSPEQVRGESVDKASDVFSFGVVCYEVLTGRHPFAGSSVGSLMHAIETADLPAIEEVDVGGRDVRQLLEQMLQKLPASRPLAREVALRWKQLLGHSGSNVLSVAMSLAPSRSRPLRVGRIEERAILSAALDAASERKGTLVAIGGEPGIGKTALIEDFLSELTSTSRVMIAQGRCSERLAGTEAYLPILDAIESLLRGPYRASCLRILEQHAPSWYFQVISGSNVQMTAPTQERLKREFRALLDELSKERTVVLFLDDVHWSDVSTVDLLAYVGRHLPSMAVLVLVTYRPTDLLLSNNAFHTVKLDLQARHACQEMSLSLLSEADIDHYLAMAFPGHAFPPQMSSRLHERTEGNPLFLISLLRFLQERDVLVESERGWCLEQSLTELLAEIPSSILSMIDIKLSLLEDRDRQLLSAASVQGYDFDSEVVAAAMQFDPAETEERLGELSDIHGLIREERSHEFPDGTASIRFRFTHVLYQNALFHALRPARRAGLAASVATALTRFHRGKTSLIASELAMLWKTARQWKHAGESFLQAAEHANRLFAYQESLQLIEHGLQAAQRLPESEERDRLELQLQAAMGAPLVAIRGYASPQVRSTQQRVLELSKRLGDRDMLVRATRVLHSYLLLSGRVRESLSHAEQFLAESREEGDTHAVIEAHNCRALSLIHLADVNESIDEFETVVLFCDEPTAQHLELRYALNPLARAKSAMAWGQMFLGRFQTAIELLDDARRLCHPSARTFSRVHVDFLTAFVRQMRGDTEDVQWLLERVIESSREHGFGFYLAMGTIWHGWVLAERGDLEKGVACIEEGMNACVAISSRACEPYVLTMYAEVLAKLGRRDDALRVIDQAFASIAATHQRLYESDLYRLRGEVLYQANDARQSEIADQQLQTALEVARRRGFRLYELRAAASIFRRSMIKGDASRAAARRALHDIVLSFREGFDARDLRDAQTLLDEHSS